MISDFLYALRPTEEGKAYHVALHEQASRAALAINVEHLVYTVPDDSLLVLQNIAVLGTAGGAQTCSEVRAYWFNPRTQRNHYLGLYQGYGIGQTTKGHSWSWGGGLLIPSGGKLYGVATYSALAVANTTQIDIAGLLIPRGNVLV